MTQAGPRRLPRRHTFDFQSITLEGMHKFHLNFTEASRIIKIQIKLKKGASCNYRSNLNLEVICKLLTEL